MFLLVAGLFSYNYIIIELSFFYLPLQFINLLKLLHFASELSEVGLLARKSPDKIANISGFLFYFLEKFSCSRALGNLFLAVKAIAY